MHIYYENNTTSTVLQIVNLKCLCESSPFFSWLQPTITQRWSHTSCGWMRVKIFFWVPYLLVNRKKQITTQWRRKHAASAPSRSKPQLMHFNKHVMDHNLNIYIFWSHRSFFIMMSLMFHKDRERLCDSRMCCDIFCKRVQQSKICVTDSGSDQL